MLNLVQQQHYEQTHKQDVFQRLQVEESELIECLLQGQSARRSKTKNDTNAGGGNAFFNDTNRALRDKLSHRGYEALKQKNIELTVNNDLKIALYLRAGCDQTGLQDGHPSSKTDLGIYTQKYLNLSQDNDPHSYDMFGQDLNSGIIPLDFELWVILHYFDPHKKVVRAELVKPVSCDSLGFLTGFDRDSRLILDLTQDDFIEKSPEFNDPIDFDEIEI